jgi:hypothetical protein
MLWEDGREEICEKILEEKLICTIKALYNLLKLGGDTPKGYTTSFAVGSRVGFSPLCSSSLVISLPSPPFLWEEGAGGIGVKVF